MAKDPAFLFYSKDWLEGTAEMTPEEKGVYIDLLAHQHQKGSLPPETKRLAKLVGISEPEFLCIWQDISTKFIPNGSNRLVNRKLNGIVTERMDKGWRNKIIGTLASIIKYSNQPYEINFKVKKTFKVEDFLACTTENLTERITEWYTKRLKSIVNVNEDAIEDGNVNEDKKGGTGESSDGLNGSAIYVVPEMFKIWSKYNPDYPYDKNKDFTALRQIGEFILNQPKVKSDVRDNNTKIFEAFDYISKFSKEHDFFKTYSLQQLDRNIQSVIKTIQDGNPKKSISG